MRKLFPICTFLLVALCASHMAKADTCNGFSNNLITNCGFESGTFSGWSGTASSYFLNGVDTGDPFTSATTPYQGVYEAALGNISTAGTLYQTFSTVIGQTYTIEFALLNDTSYLSPYANSFSAMFGSSLLFSESNVAADSYMLYNFSAIATTASTTLQFNNRNDQGYFELDSVSVAGPSQVAVTPEPSSLMLAATGLLGVVGMARRRIMA